MANIERSSFLLRSLNCRFSPFRGVTNRLIDQLLGTVKMQNTFLLVNANATDETVGNDVFVDVLFESRLPLAAAEMKCRESRDKNQQDWPITCFHLMPLSVCLSMDRPQDSLNLVLAMSLVVDV